MDLAVRLGRQKDAGLYRRHRVVDGPQGRHLNIDGQLLLNFSSNDYLGLANHPLIKQAFIEGAERYGVGSGAAHLISGHSRAHQELEEALADFTGRDRALLFSTGYMANVGVLSVLAERQDIIYQDRLNHASLIDAGLLSRASVRRYAHADCDDLRRQLLGKPGIIATDGIFSMEGDIAPMRELAAIAEQQGLMLMVDEAHGLGVMGDCGRGSAAMQGLGQDEVPILMGTLGKALGSFGAFVAGSEDTVEALIQFARPYVYTTAPPAAVACATLASLRLIQTEPGRQQRLQDNIALFYQLLAQSAIEGGNAQTPIQVIKLQDVPRLMRVQQAIEAAGMLVGAIRPPTAPGPMLRITLTSEHQAEDIERLLAVLQQVLGNE